MDYFWKENKKFVLGVAGALFLVFLYAMSVLAPLKRKTEQAARDLRAKETAFRAQAALGVPTPETLALARRDLDRDQKLIASLQGDLAFKGAEQKLPPGRLKEEFDNRKHELKKDLEIKAQGKMALPQKFTLEAVEAGTEELAGELLLRLAIVDRMVSLAVDSEVDKVDAVDLVYGADRREESVTKKEAFLNRYSVLMRFTAKSESVFRVLHGLQKKGNYLAISNCDAVREDPSKDSFGVTLAATLLKVDPKAPIEPKAQEETR